MIKQLNKPVFCVVSVMFSLTTVNAQTAKPKEPGINVSYMNTKISPKDDFFRYVNGTWLDKTEIPSDRNSWGSFNELRQKTDDNSLAILKEASKNPKYKSNTDQGKAIALFNTILDTVGRNKLGVKPLEPVLKKIDAIKNVTDLQNFLIEMEPQGGIGFFGVWIGADAKNSNVNSVSIGPGSLGLSDKDYYNADDKDSKEKRAKYELHVARMMQFIGESPAKAKQSATQILALETAMSAPRLDRVERRDRRKQYNPTAVADLKKTIPSIQWDKFFAGIGMTKVDTVIVTQPRYMADLEKIFTEKKVEDWKEYLKWSALNQSASLLSTDIENANFDFYGKTLTGALKQRPREEMALQVINNATGEALGKLYVEKLFPAEAKEKAQKMIQNVILAYENRINALSWMSADTKVKAIQKLKKITIKIGYPDKWKDYSALEIKNVSEGGTYFTNMGGFSKWDYKEDLAKLGKPVDKTEWGMSPQTVNAYYNPSYNEIV
ncbi:MAG: M13 family metallopeptidase, partial [Flavobacterium sp.]